MRLCGRGGVARWCGVVAGVLVLVAPAATAAPDEFAYTVQDSPGVEDASGVEDLFGAGESDLLDDPGVADVDVSSLEVVDSQDLADPAAVAERERQDAAVEAAVYDPDNPPLVDGQPVLTDAEIERLQEEMKVTEETSPKAADTPGQMWADQVDLPEDISRQQAVEAETQVAREQSPNRRVRRGASSCRSVFPTGIGVCGAIAAKYWSMGGPTSWLLWPTEPEAQTPDGQGWRQRFAGGFIFYHPNTGTYAIANRTAVVYERNGWERGYLGYPTADEVKVTEGDDLGLTSGWMQQFAGGRIYRSPVGQGYQVAAITGRILDRWEQLGGVRSGLGYPVSDEEAVGDNRGRQSIFQHGSIVWSPQTDAWEIIGAVGVFWHTDGGVNSKWGYPNGPANYDERIDAYTTQSFEHGEYSSATRFEEEGLVISYGQVVSKLVLKALNYLGLQAAPPPAEETTASNNNASDTGRRTRSRRSTTPFECPIYNRNTKAMNGVPIPEQYVYWGCNYDSGERPSDHEVPNYSRHDYCTKSPDFVTAFHKSKPQVWKLRDLRGACAQHDMCYDVADSFAGDDTPYYLDCNRQLKTNITNICTTNDAVGYQCENTAAVYFIATTVTHLENSKWWKATAIMPGDSGRQG